MSLCQDSFIGKGRKNITLVTFNYIITLKKHIKTAPYDNSIYYAEKRHLLEPNNVVLYRPPLAVHC